jgi:AraC family transcriptional regulator
MASEFERKHHDLLAGLIGNVLRCRSGLIRVPDLAQETGFSRFHLARLFREVTQESLEGFVRRIRLERAGFLLLNSRFSVDAVASEAGYKNPEAFARAFKSAYGVPPSRFRTGNASWKLQSPTGLHWNEHWGSHNPEELPGRVDLQYVFRPEMELAVWSWSGNYSRIADGWDQLSKRLGATPDRGLFVTIYLDNMWTHPTNRTMRADLGWSLHPGELIPKGMRKLTLPDGMYEMTTRILERHERNDAWSYVSTRDLPGVTTFDEYPEWPLPFERVQTRIVRGPIAPRASE